MESNLSMIRARLAEISRQQESLIKEAQELEIAVRVLTRLAATSSVTGASEPPQVVRVGAPASQRGLVIAALRVSADPWFASPAELRAEIEQTHSVKIKNTSFQPLLSNLKTQGVVVRDGLRIALAERLVHGSKGNRATE